MTPHFLKRSYYNLLAAIKKANPDIEVDDITSEAFHQYLDERARNPDTDYHISKPLEDYILYNINVKNSI